jgi:hypothetical protein
MDDKLFYNMLHGAAFAIMVMAAPYLKKGYYSFKQTCSNWLRHRRGNQS